MRMNVRQFVVALCSIFFLTGTSEANTIRFFVRQSTGLFEIKGSTGGRFVVQPTGEMINVRGVGRLPVRGYTDRASRGETFIGAVQGSGSGFLTVTFYNPTTRRTSNLFGPVPINFPDNSGPQTVPSNANQDSVTAVLRIGNQTISRRLPIGTR